MRLDTLDCFSLAFSRFTAPFPPPPPPPPSSILVLSGGFWLRPSGDVSSVTGLWRCSGFGGTGEKTEEKFFLDASGCRWFFSSGNMSLQCWLGPEGGGISYPNWHHRHRSLNCTTCPKCKKKNTRIEQLLYSTQNTCLKGIEVPR